MASAFNANKWVNIRNELFHLSPPLSCARYRYTTISFLVHNQPTFVTIQVPFSRRLRRPWKKKGIGRGHPAPRPGDCVPRHPLLKEKRKRGSEGYWYAYRRHEGQMVKRYVGRSAQLSMERLEEIAARLSNEDETQYLLTSASQTSHVSVPRSTRGHGKTQRAAGQPISDGNKKAGGTSALPTSAPGESAGSNSGSMRFEPLLMPKLQLPRLQKSLLPREHLLELLDKGLEHKLTLIAGPASYGKTTLVGQWIARCQPGQSPPVSRSS